MVILHVKRKDVSLFLFETTLDSAVNPVKRSVINICNGLLKIQRLCSEMELLALYGPTKFPGDDSLLEEEMKGLTLTDEEWSKKYESKEGSSDNKDPNGKRIGKMPSEKMKEVLSRVITEVEGIISPDQVKSGACLTQDHVYEAIDMIRGAVMVVYPMNLPLFDLVRCELENREILTGSEEAQQVLPPDDASLWFAGKELKDDQKLSDYFGKNEKSKVVVKLQRKGQGMPTREPVVSEEEKKKLMMEEFRRREALKKLEEDEDNSYLDSNWADNYHMKKAFHGLSNVSWKPH